MSDTPGSSDEQGSVATPVTSAPTDPATPTTAPEDLARPARHRSATLGRWLVAALALVLGTAVVDRLPTPDAVSQAPFLRTPDAEGVVTLRTARYQLVGVQGSTRFSDFGSTVRTAGVFLVVTVRHQGRTAPHRIEGVEVVDGADRTFGGADLFSSNCEQAQPGIWEQCDLAVEVASDHLPGATLHLATEGALSDAVGDDVAVFDLHVTSAQVQRWQRTTEPLTLTAATVVGP